ncbi:MAG: protoporphyrinogen oxidase HemJ [Halofilum sp. (in: g-proteobacteria)]|nr:protoporphyrinogen oxidase HemJ [Halofilum sp. (in: g-proteobacteria)]
MLWLKAFHIIAMVTWFAALFYLPRLFVYHAMLEPDDERGDARMHTMERKLYRGIMTPGGVATVASGLALMYAWGPVVAHWGWLHAKLVLVAALIAYHLWCGRLVRAFAEGRNRHGHVWYRWFNEAPTLLLIAIIILAVVRPF